VAAYTSWCVQIFTDHYYAGNPPYRASISSRQALPFISSLQIMAMAQSGCEKFVIFVTLWRLTNNQLK